MRSKAEVISGVLRTRRYAAIAVSSGAGLGAIYYVLTMSMLPQHAAVLEPWFVAASVGLTAAVSGLAGVNFALVAYKIARARMARSAGSDSSAILGGAFAAFTPGCPACTAPLAVVLGAVGGLSIFPLQGLELKALSAGVLAVSVYWVSRGLQRSSCCRIG